MFGVDGRSHNGVEPMITYAVRGVLNGDLSLHYLRWLNSNNRLILEAAFWMGPTVGAANATVRSNYDDRSHTAAQDRWIIFHLQIPADSLRFYPQVQAYYPGVTTVDLYHSQDIMIPTAVPRGVYVDYRAEFRYSSTYAGGEYNTGNFQNYNTRTEAVTCPLGNGARTRWYVGRDQANAIDQFSRTGRPGDLSELMNSFGVFSRENLAYIWPALNTPNYDLSDGFGVQPALDASSSGLYSPVAGAFDSNWLPDGSSPLVLDQADA
ncbi:putative chitinase [Seiridium unicorne]|uniref:Chitinase n=1 Tax=Seiridium unicorne TaxID=138068 RepID=A0ABR2UU02_9PEZI